MYLSRFHPAAVHCIFCPCFDASPTYKYFLIAGLLDFSISYLTAACQDFFIAGPPCTPYSNLNFKKRKVGYNPFDEPAALPFLHTVRAIRKRKPSCAIVEEA
jgi:hypothetical protein